MIFWQDQSVQLHHGDCRAILGELPAGSVRCCVTSPPYWGLRDYGVSDQIGLEPTPSDYVAELVNIFRDVRRVLAADGTLWLNIGDSYQNGKGQACGIDPKQPARRHLRGARPNDKVIAGLKSKDLVGIPWLVAFALRADGWYLRQDIIWHKPNPMPESVTDRCTKAHEYIFLLSKSERYWFDQVAVQEPALVGDNGSSFTDPRDFLTKPNLGTAPRKQRKPAGWDTGEGAHGSYHRDGRAQEIEYTETVSTTRNRRSVWTVTTKPYSGAHFATFPPDLIEPCIKAGSAKGDIVLDPFNGSGTTGAVAREWGRKYIGIELNAEYLKLSLKRFEQGVLL